MAAHIVTMRLLALLLNSHVFLQLLTAHLLERDGGVLLLVVGLLLLLILAMVT